MLKRGRGGELRKRWPGLAKARAFSPEDGQDAQDDRCEGPLPFKGV